MAIKFRNDPNENPMTSSMDIKFTDGKEYNLDDIKDSKNRKSVAKLLLKKYIAEDIKAEIENQIINDFDPDGDLLESEQKNLIETYFSAYYEEFIFNMIDEGSLSYSELEDKNSLSVDDYKNYLLRKTTKKYPDRNPTNIFSLDIRIDSVTNKRSIYKINDLPLVDNVARKRFKEVTQSSAGLIKKVNALNDKFDQYNSDLETELAKYMKIHQGVELDGKLLYINEFGNISFLDHDNIIPDIGDLKDVEINDLQDEQALLYDNNTGKWVNKTIVIDMSSKLDKNQGSENEGKYLVVGEDGNLKLTNLANKLDKNLGSENIGKYLQVGYGGNVTPVDLNLTTSLSELDDVELNFPASDNILIYDNVTNKWVNTNRLKTLEIRVDEAKIAYVFDDEDQLIDWLNGIYPRPDNVKPEDLKVGNDIFLKHVDQHDYWVSAIPVVNMSQLTILPTNKIIFDDYYTKEETDLVTNSVALISSRTDKFSIFELKVVDSGVGYEVDDVVYVNKSQNENVDLPEFEFIVESVDLNGGILKLSGIGYETEYDDNHGLLSFLVSDGTGSGAEVEFRSAPVSGDETVVRNINQELASGGYELMVDPVVQLSYLRKLQMEMEEAFTFEVYESDDGNNGGG